MTIVYYISGHGFGHASRSVEVIRELQRLEPRNRIVVRTMGPAWFLEGSLGAAIERVAVETDTGVVQIDSLRLDEDETARAAARFYADFDHRIEEEWRALRELGANVVLGDIPPLAFASAHRAGIPSVAIANFTWDWIYAGYPRFERLAPGVVDVIARAYSHATLALRLPFSGGFEPMQAVARDIPLIARKASHTREAVRRTLALEAGPVVLASFGGHGLDLPYEELAEKNRFTLVVTDHEVSRSGPTHQLRRFTLKGLTDHGLKYEDLVAAADVVVTKAGYGIVSECIANDTALLYTPRGRFREHDVFVAEMPKFLRCLEIGGGDLMSGAWEAAVHSVLALPEPPHTLQSDGASAAASVIASVSAP